MSQDDFDTTARRAIKIDPAGFLSWLFGGPTPSLRFVGWLDARRVAWPGEPDRACDTVAEFVQTTDPGPPWALVIEVQAEPTSRMFGRALVYLGGLWQELTFDESRGSTYQLAFAVVNLTGTPASTPATREFTLPVPGHPGLALRAVERYLAVESAEATLAAVESGALSLSLLAWIPLMQGSGDPAIIGRWSRAITSVARVELRGEYAGLANVFASLSKHTAPWRAAVEGVQVIRKSPFLEEIRAEGRVEVLAELIVEELRTRFGAGVSEEIAGAITSTANESVLREYLRAASRVGSLEEFSRLLGR